MRITADTIKSIVKEEIRSREYDTGTTYLDIFRYVVRKYQFIRDWMTSDTYRKWLEVISDTFRDHFQMGDDDEFTSLVEMYKGTVI